MAENPQLLAAKVEKLAAIIEDGNSLKESVTDLNTAFGKMAEAAAEVADDDGSVASVESVKLPSER